MINKLPMMVGEFDSVKRGGLAHMDLNIYDIGYEAGKWQLKF